MRSVNKNNKNIHRSKHRSSAASIDFAGNIKIYLVGGGSNSSGDGSGRFMPLSSSSSSSSVESEENNDDTLSSLSLSSNVIISPYRRSRTKKKVLLESPEEFEKIGTGEGNSDESTNNTGIMNLDLDLDNYLSSVYHMKDDECASTAAASLCNTSVSSSSSCSTASTTSTRRRRHRGAVSNRRRKDKLNIDHHPIFDTDHKKKQQHNSNNNSNSWIDSMRSVSSSSMNTNMAIFDVEGEEAEEEKSWTPLTRWNTTKRTTTATTIQNKNVNTMWDSNPDDDDYRSSNNPMFDRINFHEEQLEI